MACGLALALLAPPCPWAHAADPQYLAFQLFTYEPGTTGPLSFDRPLVARLIDDILAHLDGRRGDGIHTQLAFAVGPLTLDHTDRDIREAIRESFALAAEKQVAVVFHLDDSMFWKRRPDLWDVSVNPGNINNIEWTDWNHAAYPRRIIGWLPPELRLAPLMCYESPRIKREVARRARLIGAEIARGIRALDQRGHGHLFGGVIAGWETRLDDDNPAHPAVGYCALSRLGYSAHKPPASIDQALATVVHDFAAVWTTSLASAGVPSDKIYTHMAVTAAHMHAPLWTAFNASAHPGFTVYPSDDTAFAVVYDNVAQHRRSRWALAEGTNVALEDAFAGSGSSSSMSWESYLERAFNHGATLVNLFGWQGPDTPFGHATRSPEAIAAYRQFLQGDTVRERSSDVRDRPVPGRGHVV